MMKITPIGEKVLIKQTKKEEMTKGGLYIPEAAKEDRKQGEVLAAGTTKNGQAIPLQKGDIVLYGGYSSEEIDVDGDKFVFVDYKDILAKIEGDKL